MSTLVLNRNYALQMPSSYVDIDRDEMEYVDGGGFCGVTLIFSKRIRKLAGWVAGLYVTGFVGGKLAKMAATSPHMAGVVALISGVIGATVGWAVNKGMASVPIGQYINGYSINANIYIG